MSLFGKNRAARAVRGRRDRRRGAGGGGDRLGGGPGRGGIAGPLDRMRTASRAGCEVEDARRRAPPARRDRGPAARPRGGHPPRDPRGAARRRDRPRRRPGGADRDRRQRRRQCRATSSRQARSSAPAPTSSSSAGRSSRSRARSTPTCSRVDAAQGGARASSHGRAAGFAGVTAAEDRYRPDRDLQLRVAQRRSVVRRSGCSPGARRRRSRAASTCPNLAAGAVELDVRGSGATATSPGADAGSPRHRPRQRHRGRRRALRRHHAAGSRTLDVTGLVVRDAATCSRSACPATPATPSTTSRFEGFDVALPARDGGARRALPGHGAAQRAFAIGGFADGRAGRGLAGSRATRRSAAGRNAVGGQVVGAGRRATSTPRRRARSTPPGHRRRRAGGAAVVRRPST